MSILAAGFLIGMRHALDADHLAAIAVLLAEKPSVASAARQGAMWGIGHSITLLLVGALVIFADIQLSARLAHLFELAVGVMLVGLGLDLLRRWRTRRLPTPVVPHPPRPLGKALGIGLMHGLAGSSALILLTLSTLSSSALAFSYIGLFGVGSIAGMALLSVALAVPLGAASRQGNRWLAGTRVAASLASVALGGILIATALTAL